MMRKVWEKKKRGPAFYLVKIPLFIFLGLVNVILFSWFGHLLYRLFSNTSAMSLIDWIEHLNRLVETIL